MQILLEMFNALFTLSNNIAFNIVLYTDKQNTFNCSYKNILGEVGDMHLILSSNKLLGT